MKTIVVEVPVDPAPLVEREVTLPAYAKYVILTARRDIVTYCRVDENLVRHCVQVTRSSPEGMVESVELEVEHVSLKDTMNADYHFGLGEFAGTEVDFREALAQVRAFLGRIETAET